MQKINCEAGIGAFTRLCKNIIPIIETPVATKILRVPEDWGMFTQEKNDVVSDIATALVNDLSEASSCVECLQIERDQLKDSAISLFRTRRQQLESKDEFSEMTDTSAREKLDMFMIEAAVEAGMDGIALSEQCNLKWNCKNPDIAREFWWACTPRT